MKKTFRKSLFYYLLLMAFSSHAQFYSYQGISGLMLHLDATYGYNDPGNGFPATWKDISGNGNDMTTNLTNKPTYVSSVSPSLPFPGVYFQQTSSTDGDYMFNQTLNSTFSNTESTIFAVIIPSSSTYTVVTAQTLVSISEDGIYNEEMFLGPQAAGHHNCVSNFQSQEKSACYGTPTAPLLPNDKPALFTAVLGTTPGDIQFFINDDGSTPPAQSIQNSPTNFSAVNRRIYLCTRIRDDTHCTPAAPPAPPYTTYAGDFFTGSVLEVLAYNRKLTSTEVSEVNNYLRCKYDITYNYSSPCNKSVACGNECLRFADLKYISTGPDQTGNNCTFDAIVTAYPKNNYDLYAYEWSFPTYTSFVVGPPAPNTNIQHFTLSGSTSYSYANSVKIHAVKQTGYAWNVDSSGPCCDWLAWATVGCDNGTGLGSQKSGVEKDTIFRHADRSTSGIRIYPNPTNGAFFVETNNDKAYLVLVFDYLGRQVKSVNMKSGKAVIDLDSNPSGLYNIRILSAESKVLQLSKVSYIK